MKKIISSFVIASTLAACSFGPTVNKKFDQKQFNKGGQSVVAFTQENNVNAPRLQVGTTMVFRNDETRRTINLRADKNLRFAMIPAGSYTLEKTRLFGSRTDGNTTTSVDINMSDHIQASFSVEPGQAVYLGHIKTHIKSTRRRTLLSGPVRSAYDMDFTSELVDNFGNLNAEDIQRIKDETGLTLVSRPMRWAQVNPEE